jgi:hypothetical protein
MALLLLAALSLALGAVFLQVEVLSVTLVAGRARYPLSRFETVNTPSGTPAS